MHIRSFKLRLTKCFSHFSLQFILLLLITTGASTKWISSSIIKKLAYGPIIGMKVDGTKKTGFSWHFQGPTRSLINLSLADGFFSKGTPVFSSAVTVFFSSVVLRKNSWVPLNLQSQMTQTLTRLTNETLFKIWIVLQSLQSKLVEYEFQNIKDKR